MALTAFLLSMNSGPTSNSFLIETVITSTTKEPDNIEKTFFKRVFNTLQEQRKDSSPSVEYLIELILSTATDLFNEKGIDVLGSKKSPLSVYRETISNAVSIIKRSKSYT